MYLYKVMSPAAGHPAPISSQNPRNKWCLETILTETYKPMNMDGGLRSCGLLKPRPQLRTASLGLFCKQCPHTNQHAI
jgi:hypothetical protein